MGSPSNYYSATTQSADVTAAADFLLTQLANDLYVDGLIATGQVPPLTGLEERVAVGEFAEFNSYTYDQVLQAPAFTQQWDQALPADQAQTLLTAIQQVFNGQLTPQEFGDAMAAAT
ncbi:hypothetical protein [Pseudonocardia nigra]|uniref:hypothetical protein n=1 Tax=Pseudonocardia nigra TaxID=1921578 RepID=UPI001C5DCD2A|nr:hypothetical protein [Pseudonocardia nigra]